MNSISLASSSFLSLAFDGRYNNYSGIRLHLIAIFGCFDTKYINFIPFVSHCPDLFLVFARSIIHVNEISYVCIRAMCGSTSVILIKKTLNSSVSVSLCVFEWSMCMVKNANKHHINRLVFSKSLEGVWLNHLNEWFSFAGRYYSAHPKLSHIHMLSDPINNTSNLAYPLIGVSNSHLTANSLYV